MSAARFEVNVRAGRLDEGGGATLGDVGGDVLEVNVRAGRLDEGGSATLGDVGGEVLEVNVRVRGRGAAGGAEREARRRLFPERRRRLPGWRRAGDDGNGDDADVVAPWRLRCNVFLCRARSASGWPLCRRGCQAGGAAVTGQ
jgi:hypothetical protein